jgi:hypothetical protein
MSYALERQPAGALSLDTAADPATMLHQQEQLFEKIGMI